MQENLCFYPHRRKIQSPRIELINLLFFSCSSLTSVTFERSIENEGKQKLTKYSVGDSDYRLCSRRYFFSIMDRGMYLRLWTSWTKEFDAAFVKATKILIRDCVKLLSLLDVVGLWEESGAAWAMTVSMMNEREWRWLWLCCVDWHTGSFRQFLLTFLSEQLTNPIDNMANKNRAILKRFIFADIGTNRFYYTGTTDSCLHLDYELELSADSSSHRTRTRDGNRRTMPMFESRGWFYT